MGMQGFNFGIPAMFITMLTIVMGGLFVLVAWTNALTERIANGHWSIPTALYAFTASVGLELAGHVVLSDIPYGMTDREVLGVSLVALIWSCFLLASFILLLVSMALVRRNSEPGKRIVQAGSKVLLVIAILGFIGIVMGLPGMPLHGK
jgi:hypothetical protein